MKVADMNPWVELLNEEDLQFIQRFILASGSLKELAAVYGVTYPTIRLRLDRLIEKLKIIQEQQKMDLFERTLRAEFADGRIEEAAFQRLLKAHRENARQKEV